MRRASSFAASPLRVLQLGGLAGTAVATCLVFWLGFLAHVGGAPGLPVVAALLLGHEALRRGPQHELGDRVTARLTFVGTALVLGGVAFVALRHPTLPDSRWLEAVPCVGLMLVMMVSTSSIVASSIVERLPQTAPALHRAAVAAVGLEGGLVGLALKYDERLPCAWAVCAALGGVLAFAMLARAAEHHDLCLRLDGAVQATIDASGWITCDDGTPPFRHAGTRRRPGPVVVTLGPARTPGYRTAEAREVIDLREGSLDRLRHVARLEAASRDALALGAAALTTLPLLVALLASIAS